MGRVTAAAPMEIEKTESAEEVFAVPEPDVPWVTIVDARVQKEFVVGNSRLTVFLDALNLNNENSPQAVASANVTNGQYQYPTTFIAPRRLMLSGKFSF